MVSLYAYTSGKPNRIIQPFLVLAGKRTTIDDAVVAGNLNLPELFTLADGEWQLSC